MANPEHVKLLQSGREEWNRRAQRAPLGTRNERHFDLRDLEMPGADFSRYYLAEADLTGAHLERANLTEATVVATTLRGAQMAGVVLRTAMLANVDLESAELGGANLEEATLINSSLRDTRLRDAVAIQARIENCDLNGCDVEGLATGGTVWANLDLRRVSNLDRIRHFGPSTVGLNTVRRSEGQIAEVFLRGSGVPDEMIAYVQSLGQSASPIRLYSCFISYSSKDQEFCQRLHNDLQAAGVRCWFAREDLRIGDRFRDEIESAIRRHDKLLLVLSDHSVNSSWVQTEVESAIEREQRQGARVLFPVRLDDTVVDTPRAWAADIRRQCHIGDFSRWQDHEHYTKAFERLLRDLRAKPTSA